jgi:hypothetical protein
VPSTTHGGGNGAFTLTPSPTGSNWGVCDLPSNPMPARDILAALTQATVDWITKGIEMPPSRYPKLADGTLVPETQLDWPKIPGVRSPIGLVNTVIDYDYGPNFRYNDMSGFITNAPIIVKQLIPTYVPQVDQDGNELAGVWPLLRRLPLGTYTGWNVTKNGFYKGQICSFTGGFIPFARTKAERLANGDPRLSIEERYGNAWGYLYQADQVLNELVAQRYLLPADAQSTWNSLLNALLSTSAPINFPAD